MIATATIPDEAISFQLVRGPVVYFLMLGDECVYVGSTCRFAIRMGTHQATMRKHPELAFDGVRYIHVEHSNMLATEKYWQNQLMPRYKMNPQEKARMVRVRERLAEVGDDVANELAKDLTEIVNDALREYLQKLGRWPVPPKDA